MKKDNPNRDRARGLARKLAEMSDSERAEFAARCPAILTIDGRALSGKNGMLIILQHETATMVGGFRQWLAAGRAVRQGEKALYIFAPSSARAAPPAGDAGAETGGAAGDGAETVTRFLMVPVFDVSQTDAIEIETTAAA